MANSVSLPSYRRTYFLRDVVNKLDSKCVTNRLESKCDQKIEMHVTNQFDSKCD